MARAVPRGSVLPPERAAHPPAARGRARGHRELAATSSGSSTRPTTRTSGVGRAGPGRPEAPPLPGTSGSWRTYRARVRMESGSVLTELRCPTTSARGALPRKKRREASPAGRRSAPETPWTSGTTRRKYERDCHRRALKRFKGRNQPDESATHISKKTLLRRSGSTASRPRIPRLILRRRKGFPSRWGKLDPVFGPKHPGLRDRFVALLTARRRAGRPVKSSRPSSSRPISRAPLIEKAPPGALLAARGGRGGILRALQDEVAREGVAERVEGSPRPCRGPSSCSA